ncbi:MAG: nucleoside-diphosphate kinase [Bacteroidota bacterium]
MASTFTFSMIKPDAVQGKHIGAIINMIEQAEFSIRALKLTHLTYEAASLFYQVHKDRPFYEQMCRSMTTGPVVAMLLAKDNAVVAFRKLIGATDPTQAAADTIRARFGQSIEANAVHGSDADETATIEANFFFPELVK